MTIIGIIAEFNPFHNGHLHLLQSSLAMHPEATIVCVMSGNFVQRGLPSICDKWSRAKMAVMAGVDLVIEIPFGFATRSAYYFARGSLELLQRTGVVTHLLFGSEHGRIEELDQIACLLENESADLKKSIQHYLDMGNSFPRARELALREIHDLPNAPGSATISEPNNILAIEYLRVIKELKLDIIPLTIARIGSAYHSNELEFYSSANAIRQHIKKDATLKSVIDSIPPSSHEVIINEMSMGRAPVYSSALEFALLYKLRTISDRSLREISEVNEGLEYRILEAANKCCDLTSLKHAIKNKRYNMTKINRILIHTLFSFDKDTAYDFYSHGPLYLHVLAFSAKGRKILQMMKNNAKVPILSRGKDIAALVKQKTLAAKMLNYDIMASDFYALMAPKKENRHGGRDFAMPPFVGL